MIQLIRVPGPPRPKARPQKGRDHWYVPSAEDEKRVAWYFVQLKGEFLEGPVRIDTFFYVNARSRADEDNLRKLVLDALQRVGVLKNDRQVAGGLCWREVVSKGGEGSVVRIGRPDDPWDERDPEEIPEGLRERLA